MAKQNKYNTFYLYHLVNNDDQVEYIGVTSLPNSRWKAHYYNKKGKFYKRTDFRLWIMETFNDKSTAKLAEHREQKMYFPEVESDREKTLRGVKAAGSNPQVEGRRKGGLATNGKGLKKVNRRVFTHSCGKTVKTAGASAYHAKTCGCHAISWIQT